ncbi:MAG: FAD-dependent oxidoreductase [Desulfobacterales bacterium]|nr:FAD-dependent oxidoreductase [Desulfobacterales bacterium]
MSVIIEKERQTPVLDEADVLVVGSGPGGLSAAIAAARAGVKTILIERYGCFGGNMTVVGVESLAWYRHEKTIDSEGIGIEFENRAMEMGATAKEVQSDSQALNTELFKHVADTLVTEAGVIPLLHCYGVEPIVEGDTIKGVVTESKSGRLAVLGKVVIDATGDADIAFRAGAPCTMEPVPERQAVTLAFNCCGVNKDRFMEYIKEDPATYGDWGEDWAQQTSGLENDMFSPYFQKQFDQAIEKNIIPKSDWDLCGSWSTITDDGQATYMNLVHLGKVDITDVRDLTRAEMDGRRQVLDAIKAMNHTIPGFEKARLRNYAMTIGTRDSRKIQGEYELTGHDVLNEARFEDSIGVFPEFVDGFGVLRLPVTGRYFQVPYRSILPKRIESLLVAGRSIAGDQISHAATRNMMCCAVSGQGAGVAAAVAAKSGKPCRQVPVKDIQNVLAEQNVRCHY